MKKKLLAVAIIVCCVTMITLTVNAASRKGITLSYSGNTMQAVMNEKIGGECHSSIYPTSKSSGTIKVKNIIFRQTALGALDEKLNSYLYVKEVKKSYIYNMYLEGSGWGKSEWWIQTSGASITGDFYFSNGHDSNNA